MCLDAGPYGTACGIPSRDELLRKPDAAKSGPPEERRDGVGFCSIGLDPGFIALANPIKPRNGEALICGPGLPRFRQFQSPRHHTRSQPPRP